MSERSLSRESMSPAADADLVQFNSNCRPQLQTFPLLRLIEDVYASLASQLSAQEIETITDVPAGQFVTADRQMFRLAVLNLVRGALDAMPDGGTLVVTSCFTPRGLELEIADSGPGLLDEEKSRAFEPLDTTDRGLAGLRRAVVYRIAQAHGGDATAVNCPEGGAAFTLRIPQQAAALKEAA